METLKIEDFSQYSDVVSAVNGTATIPGLTVVTSRNIPGNGNIKAYIEKIKVQVLDLGALTDVYFAFRFNGSVINPFFKLPSFMFFNAPWIDVGMEFTPGLLDIIALNYRSDATAIFDVQASWVGEIRRN